MLSSTVDKVCGSSNYITVFVMFIFLNFFYFKIFTMSVCWYFFILRTPHLRSARNLAFGSKSKYIIIFLLELHNAEVQTKIHLAFIRLIIK